MEDTLNKYMNLSLSEIQDKIEKNRNKLDKIWDEDDGSSWDNYCKKCEPYWNDNKLLHTVESLKIPFENIELRPLEDWEKDEECVHISIKKFTDWCKYGGVTSYDGEGYYATKNEVSNICALPWAFENGYIRKDFTHVCWYNK